jgi:hypothetical protein
MISNTVPGKGWCADRLACKDSLAGCPIALNSTRQLVGMRLWFKSLSQVKGAAAVLQIS